MMLIGLTGPAGAGKDTVADLLVHHHGFRKTSFAESLYREVSDAFDLPVTDLARRDTKETSMDGLEMVFCHDLDFVEVVQRLEGNAFDWHIPYSPRQILQWWGTDYRRAQNQDYWIDQVRQRIHIGSSSIHWVIPDVRFQNEADLIHEMGGQFILVRRQGVQPVAGHVSEAFWRACHADGSLDNDGAVDDLLPILERMVVPSVLIQ